MATILDFQNFRILDFPKMVGRKKGRKEGGEGEKKGRKKKGERGRGKGEGG